jgi:hypothetical protein
MDLYEVMYVALVRRLEEIADDARPADYGMNRLFDYDMVARAHALGLEKIRDEAEVDCD